MDISRTTLKRAGQLVGYFVLGLVGTGAIALGLHEIEEKAHDFSRGMNPTTHDTISPR